MNARELAIAAPLLALAIAFGVYPQAIFRYMTPSVDRTVQDLADWTRDNVETPGHQSTSGGENKLPAADVVRH
jgi:NADH:ubiquinone oxidoreductase subunit 4 (subunit M)